MPDVYTLEPGRNIYKNGQPFLSVNREGELAPAYADAMTRYLVSTFNFAQPNLEVIYQLHSDALRNS